MALEPQSPSYWVMSAGTGGTSAAIGKFLHQHQKEAKLCVVDPENSVFYHYFHSKDEGLSLEQGSRIEGIGRPRVEKSFLPKVVDSMLQIADEESIAAMLWGSALMRRPLGASTGTHLAGALRLVRQMQQRGERGAIVTLIADGGERYLDTYIIPSGLRKTLLGRWIMNSVWG